MRLPLLRLHLRQYLLLLWPHLLQHMLLPPRLWLHRLLRMKLLQ
jgi:hypothetical protein